MPPARRMAIVDEGDGARLVWIGQIPTEAIVSGPPCYVFNRQGRLVEWTGETGEGGPLDGKPHAAYLAQALSIAEAEAWFHNANQ